jgi:GNAT superfamily N-acetyltransferase/rhodanese-related sulfurtransferase
MSVIKQAIISVRSFVADDADSVSALFRAVYGDFYIYPDVYLPSMIYHNNQQQRWLSMVACIDGKIVGHAALWRHPDSPESAELALNVVHSSARGLGIATLLGRHLCDQAREQGLRWLTIKQVSSHKQSQRLAQTLGFHTIGLLLDYVTSPFGSERRESVVLGCLPLQPYPIPSLAWPQACRGWISPMEQHFGSNHGIFSKGVAPIIVATHEQRIEVTLNDLHPNHLHEIVDIPKERLVYLKLRLGQRTPAAMQQLRRAGFAYAGFMPSVGQEWYSLMQRGYQAHELDLYCPIAMALHQDSLRLVAQ